jgi:hypothetical protein
MKRSVTMDTQDMMLLQIAILAGAPIIFGLLTIAVAWRTISHRLLYSCVAMLVFLGLSSVFYSGVHEIYMASGASEAIYFGNLIKMLLVTAALVAAVGFPVLWRLHNVLRASRGSADSAESMELRGTK